MKNKEDKVIITAALTGGGTPLSLNSAIPCTPQQIAEDAYRCWKAGAAMVHLHMRNDDGTPCNDTDRFVETVKRIRAYEDCDVIINCTSSAPLPKEERAAHFLACPELIEVGSYDAGTMNFNYSSIFENSPEFLVYIAKVFEETNVKPEIEIFDLGMMDTVDHYLKEGILKAPLHYQFVLGVGGGMQSTVEHLVILKNSMPPGSTWSAFGIGRGHLPIMFATLAMGGHIRVGLEDNIYLSRGVKATNVQLVDRAVEAIRIFGKEVATPAEAREILSLPQLGRPFIADKNKDNRS